MSTEPLDFNRTFTRRPDLEGQSKEKEMQLKYSQEIEEKILNNVFKINIFFSIICIILIIFYFASDNPVIFMEKKLDKSKK